MRKFKLVSDYKQAWKWLSIQIITLIAALQVAWMTLPDDVKAGIPLETVGSVTIFLSIAGAIGRVIDQNRKPDNLDNKTKSKVKSKVTDKNRIV